MKQTSAHQTSPAFKWPLFWRSVVTLALLVLAAWLIVTNRMVAARSLTSLHNARLPWLFMCLILSFITFSLAALIYQRLALHRLRFGRTIMVELAASFVNRLLPAGLGGLGLHGLYLHRQKHSSAEATAVVSVNNLLGITAHLSLLLLVCSIRPQLASRFKHPDIQVPWLVVGCSIIALAVLVATLPAIRNRIRHFAANLLVSLRRLRIRNIVLAYLTALLLTATYTMTLYAAARSVGVALAPLQVFIVFSIGIFAGTVAPTPGGLVGIEAGLYAGFIVYGVQPATAAASVLLYRLTTYWIPLLPGAVALFYVRSRKLV